MRAALRFLKDPRHSAMPYSRAVQRVPAGATEKGLLGAFAGHLQRELHVLD
jgi:hypothetical protein